jgi:hypothetical protein
VEGRGNIHQAWLKDQYGCEVVTFTADLGQGEELEPARLKAEKFGVKEIYIDDLREVRGAETGVMASSPRRVCVCRCGGHPYREEGGGNEAAATTTFPGNPRPDTVTGSPLVTGVCEGLRVSHVPRQRHLRGSVSAGYVHRAPAHRQAPDRDRQRGGRGRRVPRRHRQGQRPGELVIPCTCMAAGGCLRDERQDGLGSSRGEDDRTTRATRIKLSLQAFGLTPNAGALRAGLLRAQAGRQGGGAVAHLGASPNQHPTPTLTRWQVDSGPAAPTLTVWGVCEAQDLNSRTKLCEYAEAQGIDVPGAKRNEAPFSCDANLLHISYEGNALEDPWVGPDESMFTRSVSPEQVT